MKFELTIPPTSPEDPSAVMTVEAPNWLAALQKALAQRGASQIPKGKAVCEVRADGTIVVRNAADGRTFFIRNLPTESKAPPKPEKHSVQLATSYPTITYLEAELKEMRNARGPSPPPLEPNESAVQTSGHPCMTFSKAEIDRRLREHRAAQVAQREGRQPDEAEKRREKRVKFIQVVDVVKNTPDTLTALRVDLDMLRKASDHGKIRTTAERRAPEGFEWLSGPLESALSASTSLSLLADRTLRLSLAAVPSRLALFLLKSDCVDGLRIISVVGGKYSHDVDLPVNTGPTPVSALATSGVSMALEGGPGQFSTEMLTSLLGHTPENALLAAITSGSHALGAILLAESIANPTYLSTDLSVSSYIAGRVYDALTSLMGAEIATSK